jgi:hypothetical protein
MSECSFILRHGPDVVKAPGGIARRNPNEAGYDQIAQIWARVPEQALE